MDHQDWKPVILRGNPAKNNSQKKGVYGEEFGIHLCNQLFPSCEIEDTSVAPISGSGANSTTSSLIIETSQSIEVSSEN